MALPVRFANGFLIDQNTKARAFGDSQEASFRCQHFGIGDEAQQIRSEEHTSELQSLMRISYAVFCLKNKTRLHTSSNHTPPPPPRHPHMHTSTLYDCTGTRTY